MCSNRLPGDLLQQSIQRIRKAGQFRRFWNSGGITPVDDSVEEVTGKSADDRSGMILQIGEQIGLLSNAWGWPTETVRFCGCVVIEGVSCRNRDGRDDMQSGTAVRVE